MPAASPIDLAIFDLVDDFARRIKAGNPQAVEVVVQGDTIVVFCETLFDQLFSRVLGSAITGFDAASKRKAVVLAEGRAAALAGSANLRALLALFEKFCDLYQDVVEGSYGAAAITYRSFHDRYLSRLLDRTSEWAREGQYQALADRVTLARLVYADAIGAMRW